jgi:hypothetical protein
MRQTTKKLLDHLKFANQISYRVDDAVHPDDGEVILLSDYYVLVVDEEAALPTVSLIERMAVGGNEEIDTWVVHNNAVLDNITAAVMEL